MMGGAWRRAVQLAGQAKPPDPQDVAGAAARVMMFVSYEALSRHILR